MTGLVRAAARRRRPDDGFALIAVMTALAVFSLVVISLLSLAISAVVKWGIAARALRFAIFIVPSGVGAVVNEIFHTKLGSAINLNEVVYSIANNAGTVTRSCLPVSTGGCPTDGKW